MRGAVRKMGNSSGVIIPKLLLTEVGAKVGDEVDLRVESGTIVIAPLRGHPRAGWARDAQQLARAGDGALVWPEFGNFEDGDLRW